MKKNTLLLLFSFLAYSSYSQNLVADFPFNGDANDISGYEQNGTVNGATITQDRFSSVSSAYQFDGVDDFVEVPVNQLTELKDGFSISAWFKSQGENTFQTIVSRGYGLEGTYSLTVYNDGTNKVLRIFLEGEVILGTEPISDDWNHVVLINELGTDGVKIFLNGKLYLTHTTANTYNAPTPFNLRIGNNERDEDYFFNGIIDDIKIYDRSLNQDEANYLFNLIPLNSELETADFGNALDFDGINDFIQLPTDILNDVNNGFTVETWAKWEGSTIDNTTIFEIVQGGDQVQGFIKFDLFQFSTASNGQQPCSYNIDNPNPVDNQWHHLAISVNVELGIGYYYVDGIVVNEFILNTCELDGSCAYFDCNLPPDTVLAPKIFGLLAKDRVGGGQQYANLFNLGRDTYGFNFFKGRLDEFRIWDYPRSEDQIKSNRFLPVSANSDGLVYYLNFDEGDAGGNNKNLTRVPNKVDGLSGELLGFQLESNSSNWVKSDFNLNSPLTPYITDVFPHNVFNGQLLTISGVRIPNESKFIKVLIGNEEAKIISIKFGQILVEVPNNIKGMSSIEIVNSLGSSNSMNIHVVNAASSLEFTWNSNTIYSQITPKALEIADFNKDGFVDVVLAGNNQLVLFLNDKSGNFPEATVLENSDKIYNDLIVFDMDADGDQDIITLANYVNAVGDYAYDFISFENNQTANWPATVVATGFGIQNIEKIDANRDGLIDFVSYGNISFNPETWGITLFTNLGNSTYDAGQIVVTGLSGERIERPRGLEVSDMDNDGFFDIVANTRFSDADEDLNTVVYKGGRDFDFIRNRIGTASPYSEVISLVDINNDGLVDIGNLGYQSAFYLFLNKEDMSFEQNLLDQSAPGVNALRNGDINGDGLTDFICSVNFEKNQISSQIKLFQQINETSYIKEDIPVNIFNAIDLRLVDLNNDGDLDILTISDNDNRLTKIEHVYNGKEFYEFNVLNQESETVIDSVNFQISVLAPNNIELARVKPTFLLPIGSRSFVNGIEQFSGVTEIDARGDVIYKIVAESGESVDWTLTINPLPGRPFITELDDVTQSEAEVEWNPTTFTDSYWIEASEDDFDTFTVYQTTRLDTILSLTAGTNYRVRMKSINAFGESEYSVEEEFTTIPAEPEIAFINEITSLSAVINWFENSGTENYLLDVSKDSTFNELVGGYNNRGVASLAESIIGLQAGRTYYTRIRANNESGTSGNSDTITFITIPAKPNLVVRNIKQREITISWPPLSGVAGYYLEAINSIDTILFELDPTFNNIRIDTLNEATSYTYRLSAYNVSGVSEVSESVTILTIPATPDSLRVEGIKNTSAKLLWGEVAGANSYLLEVSTDNFSTKLSEYNPKIIGAAAESLTELTGGVNYSYRLRSINNSGESPYSEVISFSTIPNSPIARAASAVTTSSFTANWDAVAGDNIGYYLEVSKNPDFLVIQKKAFVTDGLSKAFLGLENGVSYWYRVAAIKANDTSQLSNRIFVEQPLQIIDFQFNNEKSIADQLPSNTSFIVKGGTNQFNVSIRYKGILSDVWSDRINLQAENQQYNFEFGNSLFDAIGLQFEVIVSDELNSISELDNFIYLTDTEEEIITLDLSDSWQLFSIPYIFEDNLIETIFDEMGPFEYKSEWRLMQYDGQKYVDAGGGINRIVLGESYWFYTTKAVSIKLEGVKINTASPFKMTLSEGWNQIGNPYNIPINWNSVVASNNESANLENLYLFNSNTQQFERSDRLEAFSGGFVWANSATDVNVSLFDNNDNQRITDVHSLSSHDIDSEEWKVNLLLNQTVLASVGMTEEALPSKDLFDQLALPRFINYTEMYSLHEDYFYPYFKEDIRPLKDQESWLFHFETNQSNGLNTLKWDNSLFKYAKKQLWLINENNGDLINMNTANEYSFYDVSSQQFSIHLLSDALKMPTPINVLGGVPFPNPTNDLLNLRIGLPTADELYDVNLTLYSIKGDKVKKVSYNSLPHGFHLLSTSIKEPSIQAGVYFLEIQINGAYSLTKMEKIIVKD